MKILILGVTGMLGHMAYRILSKYYDVYGTCRNFYSNTPAIHGIIGKQYCFEKVDILDIALLAELLEKLQPQVVLML